MYKIGAMVLSTLLAYNAAAAPKPASFKELQRIRGTGSIALNTGIDSALADVDRDGDVDVLEANATWIRFIENVGTRTRPKFAKPRNVVYVDALSVKSGVGLSVGDINSDGYPDIVISTTSGTNVYLNTGKW